MRITIIGTRNTATVLGKLIKSSGHTIREVYGRNKENTLLLAEMLQASPVYDLREVSPESDMYILAVSDDAISKVAELLRLSEKIVVHTSGAVSKNALKAVCEKYGVLYPLQSLRKELLDIPDIPFLVDGSDNSVTIEIKEFARSISENVQLAGDEERLKLHIAAVIVSNFSNYLFTVANDYCLNEHLDFTMLIPLIRETVNRINFSNPKDFQTGPAMRGDTATIAKHLEVLSAYPDLKNIYNELSESIIKFYSKK